MNCRSYIYLLLLSIIFVTSSCSKENDDSSTTNARFTVMLYGCGGATLDDAFFDNLKQAIAYGCTDEVKMTYQMKLSKIYVENHDVGNMTGTFRMLLPERMDTTGLDVFKLPTLRVSDSSLPLCQLPIS